MLPAKAIFLLNEINAGKPSFILFSLYIRVIYLKLGFIDSWPALQAARLVYFKEFGKVFKYFLGRKMETEMQNK